MITVPIGLFKLREADDQFLQHFAQAQVTQAVASASIAVDIVNTFTGRHLILTTASLQATPSAAVAVRERFLSLMTPDQSQEFVIKQTSKQPVEGEGAVNVIGTLNWSGSIIVPPRWRVRGTANFSGAISNRVRIDAMGYLIPVGNLLA